MSVHSATVTGGTPVPPSVAHSSPPLQPPVAHDVWSCVELKSLKLYLGSFRNHGAFHEDCTVAIGKRLRDLLEPRYLRIGGFWYPRGGIPIDVFWQTGEPPKTVWLPDPGVPPYRGR